MKEAIKEPMKENIRKCLYESCSTEFCPRHGNQRYCSPKCKGKRKSLLQGIQYGVLKEFRKGFLNNYKIFENLFSDNKPKTLSLTQLEILGFNYNCFYGDWEDDKENTWCIVVNYRFLMYYDKDEPFVKIIKS